MDKISSMNAFIKVVESRSFSGAAMKLGVSCSAVTRSISNIEMRLGVKLMERTTRRISLTPAGESYLSSCKNVLSMIESAEFDISGRLFELTGTIQVGLSNFHGSRLFSPLLTKFAKIHPGVQFDIRFFDLYDQVIASETDIVFLISDKKGKFPESVSLGVIPMQLVASPKYISQRGSVTDPADLLRHQCLNLSSQPTKAVWQFIENSLINDYVVNSYISTRNGDNLLQMSLDGFGIICLPKEIAKPYLESGALLTVLDDYSLAPLEASIAMSRTKLTYQRTKALSAFASNEFS
jgi:DNA-binding transcriptional LysR family regulator